MNKIDIIIIFFVLMNILGFLLSISGQRNKNNFDFYSGIFCWIASLFLLASLAIHLNQSFNSNVLEETKLTEVIDTPFPTATSTFIPLSTLIPSITPTPSPMPIPEVRFAVIGDYGIVGESLEQVATLIDSWDVDFITTTGDNYYGGKWSSYEETINPHFSKYIENNSFFPSIGNHDWNKDTGYKPYLDYFTLPGNERYYSFSQENVDFFVINSDMHEPDGGTPDSIQGEWLKEGLANSTADWQIVYFHHTPYSSGENKSLSRMRWPFAEWGADVVMAGHDHVYERLEIDGIPYFVNGLGGGGIYKFDGVYPGSQVRYNGNHGAMLVVATPFEIVFQFVNVDGRIIDTHRIRR